MISENSPWVELSVKAATRTWTKSGKNMGLAILVEDQDGGTLKASKYFKGATCTVGTVDTRELCFTNFTNFVICHDLTILCHVYNSLFA